MFGKDSQGVVRRWTSTPSQEVRAAAAVAAEELASVRPYADPPRYAVSAFAPSRGAWDNGEKFPGGFGPTLLLTTDYWTLRARSAQLFETNIYGRGVIRRLLTNELNTGLHLECTPVESVLGKEEDSLADWSEDVESRFLLWAKDPYLCDYYQRSTFGALQVQLRRESLLDGDALVVVRQDQRTKLPRIQIIRGASVENPLTDAPQKGNKICHGVEIDPTGKHVAFWVRQEDGSIKRLPAWGEKSGRRIAWLVYGTDKRIDDVRGKPLLSLVLQSLREVDRYRDSTQRKATILSMLTAFITKDEEGKASRAFAAGAVRKDAELEVGDGGEPRTYKTQMHHPGLVLDELRKGEKPHAFQVNGTTESFGDFEEAIICAVAWTLEIPPEILRLSFSSNYSASQAAVNEFKGYLNKMRMEFAEAFCEPIYQEWLISEVLNARIDAPGLLDAWRDYFGKFEIVGAWLLSDWTGNIKPSVDPVKTAEGYEKLIEMGLCTRDRASRETTGTKFSRNARKLVRENVQVAEANKPLAELEALKKPVPPKPPGAGGPPDDKTPAKPAKPPKKDAVHEMAD
jgi:lambda family phage portal protein